MPEELSAHNWRIANLADTRENVIEAVQAAATVPEAMKSAIVEAINATHANARLVKIDVHCHVGKAGNKKAMQSGHWCIIEL